MRRKDQGRGQRVYSAARACGLSAVLTVSVSQSCVGRVVSASCRLNPASRVCRLCSYAGQCLNTLWSASQCSCFHLSPIIYRLACHSIDSGSLVHRRWLAHSCIGHTEIRDSISRTCSNVRLDSPRSHTPQHSIASRSNQTYSKGDNLQSTALDPRTVLITKTLESVTKRNEGVGLYRRIRRHTPFFLCATRRALQVTTLRRGSLCPSTQSVCALEATSSRSPRCRSKHLHLLRHDLHTMCHRPCMEAVPFDQRVQETGASTFPPAVDRRGSFNSSCQVGRES